MVTHELGNGPATYPTIEHGPLGLKMLVRIRIKMVNIFQRS